MATSLKEILTDLLCHLHKGDSESSHSCSNHQERDDTRNPLFNYLAAFLWLSEFYSHTSHIFMRYKSRIFMRQVTC
jgi:hypothetical protein